MTRVARPGGTLLVADLLGSDDPAQAALHDRIERLCDPTHVRALPLAEFERLFRAQRDSRCCGGRPRSSTTTSRSGSRTAAPTRRPRTRFARCSRARMDGDRAGLAVYRRDGRLRFRHRTVAVVARRA